MLRSTFDKLLATLGALLALLLLIISALAFWASSFAQGTVSSQLKDQAITMPTEAQFPKGQEDCLKPYAGQPLDNGDKAKAYSDCYIKAHMNASSGGRTFSQVAEAQMAAQKKDPNSAETKQLTALKESLFQGNSLRSMLLTAYAFGTMGRIALIGAITSLIGAILFGILSALGFSHARKSGDAPLERTHTTTTPVTTHTESTRTEAVRPAPLAAETVRGDSRTAPQGKSRTMPQGDDAPMTQGDSRTMPQGDDTTMAQGESRTMPQGDDPATPESGNGATSTDR